MAGNRTRRFVACDQVGFCVEGGWGGARGFWRNRAYGAERVLDSARRIELVCTRDFA